MMNYKLVQAGIADVTNTNGDYVTQIYDIIENSTNQVVEFNVPAYLNKAKNLCRHLNMGGGFDGNTPAFFLARIPRQIFSESD